MPAKGNKFNVDKNVPVVGKILSRKQRKRLEQIVDKKKKKEGRAELLAALSSVQVKIIAFKYCSIAACSVVLCLSISRLFTESIIF